MKAPSFHIFLLHRKCSVNISVVKTHFCQAFLPHFARCKSQSKLFRRAFKLVCWGVVLFCHRTLPVTKLWDDWGRMLARRVVLCQCRLCIYLIYVIFLAMVVMYLLHTDKNVQRNIYVNIETMLGSVPNICRCTWGWGNSRLTATMVRTYLVIS